MNIQHNGHERMIASGAYPVTCNLFERVRKLDFDANDIGAVQTMFDAMGAYEHGEADIDMVFDALINQRCDTSSEDEYVLDSSVEDAKLRTYANMIEDMILCVHTRE